MPRVARRVPQQSFRLSKHVLSEVTDHMGKTIMIKLLHCGRIWRNAPEHDVRPAGARSGWSTSCGSSRISRVPAGNTEEVPRNHR
ncbi:poly-beta-hydroxybutyrate polymerase domain protein [Burkholderia pseudomallei]|nr:poly-beta-hydroxybutyrate polymerase domain protein [Burkholderia pseudomallei]